MKRILLIVPIMTTSIGCSTLDQSFRLGGITGSTIGAAATYAAHQANGSTPNNQEVATSAAIGLSIGLITSYIIHQQVALDREDTSRQTEIYFGDLPPSPFVFPQPKIKKGGH